MKMTGSSAHTSRQMDYSVIALAPNAPATAEATAIITFKIVSHRDLLIAITLHTSFPMSFLNG